MKRRHLQCIVVFRTQNFSEIVILKGKASMLFFSVWLDFIRECDFSDSCWGAFVGSWGENRCSLQCCVTPRWDAQLHSAWPGSGHPVPPCPRSPRSCRRSWLRGCGTAGVDCACREEQRVMVLHWGNLCRAFRKQIPGKMRFVLVLVKESVTFQMENAATQPEDR